MINKKEQIIEYFKSGIKSKDNLKLGVEHEKFVFDLSTKKRADYNKIVKMFECLFEFGWKPIFEGKNIIGLNKNDKNITLEPGNQIELSGAKLDNIHQACSESQNYLFELNQVLKKNNLKIISAGFDPISKLSDVPNNPKKRYTIMTSDMPDGGSLSLDMMYRTAGTQLNIDYSSEEDFVKKFKLLNSLVPISIALFANSSVLEKKNSNYLSYRSKVWQETSRGGLPEIFFDNMNFEKYSDFIMNSQMLFVQNGDEYLSAKNYKFLDFMNGKINEINNRIPTEYDLTTHLGTIFTENRLKKYIELRSMDACGWDCLCAGPAYNAGLVYGNLNEAYEVVSKWDKNKVINAYFDAPKKGFNTILMGKDLYHWSKVFLSLSKKGMKKRDIVGKGGYNEVRYLNHLERIIEHKVTGADLMIDKFSNNENLDTLYD